MDDTKLVPISRENLDKLMAICDEHGMPRSKRWYERLLFSGFQKDDPNKCRGYLVQSDSDGIVGCLCLAPIEGWFNRTRKKFYRVANFACRKKYGVHALELVAEILEKTNGDLTFTNSLANQKSFMCWKFARFHEGPEFCRHEYFVNIGMMGWTVVSKYALVRPVRMKIIYSLLHHFDWAWRKLHGLVARSLCQVFEDFSSPLWNVFWDEFLSKSDGIVTSRSPAVLSELFNDSLHAGTMVLLAYVSDGKIRGYVLMRKVAIPFPGYCYYRIADWCAIGNDYGVLKQLIRSAVDYCFAHNALSLEYIGGNRIAVSIIKTLHPNDRVLDHQTFVYHVDDKDIMASLNKDDGWFFGPYDGDHCLGYAGYVDL